MSRIFDALEAKTWGELKEKLPPDEYEQIVCTLFDDNEEPRPEDTDPFDSMCVPGHCDGDYPNWLQLEMDSYLPDAILEKYGSFEHTMLNGSYYHIEKEHEEAICKDLWALGFDVVRRGDLYFC